MLRRPLILLLISLVGLTTSCSLLAPTDEELFGKKGEGGAGGVGGAGGAGGAGGVAMAGAAAPTT